MNIESYKGQINELCRQNGIQTCHLIGSAAAGTLNQDSDIDMVIDFRAGSGDYFERFMNLKLGLEKLFDRQVDLLIYDAIRNPFLKEEIDNTKELVYAA